jgi:predicted dehydrogenase
MRTPELIGDNDVAPADTNVVSLEFPRPHRLEPRHTKTNRTRRLRVAVLGCGYWGSNYIRILHEMDPEATSAIEHDPRVLEKVTSAYPLTRAYSDLESALSEIDALIIATPPATHAELAIKCLSSGKHVLIEKPMATSSSEAFAMMRAAERSNAILMVGHTFEYNGAIRNLKQLISSGELGHISHIHSARLKGPYRTDINVIWDMLPHDVSILNYLVDCIPSVVVAESSMNGAGIADTVFVKLEYPQNGVSAHIHCSWLGTKKVRDVTVVGCKRIAIHEDTVKGPLHIYDRVTGSAVSSSTATLSHNTEPLLVQVRHFLSCIHEGKRPQTDAHNGVAVVAVLEAIERSVISRAPAHVIIPSESEMQSCALYGSSR